MKAANSNAEYTIDIKNDSGFYSTTRELLLAHFGAKNLVITGFSTDICILFTASDAYLRDFEITVPRDCVTSNDLPEHERALKYIERVLKADPRPLKEINFK
ncbi:MAG: cysteine hydrolase [Pyrinomonadaceae bacterium]|nr:cysteine hydrolase [Pyrinomonadaceae bacterium]